MNTYYSEKNTFFSNCLLPIDTGIVYLWHITYIILRKKKKVFVEVPSQTSLHIYSNIWDAGTNLIQKLVIAFFFF